MENEEPGRHRLETGDTRFLDDPDRPYKAVVATLLAFAVGCLTFYIADGDSFTVKDAAEALIAGLVSAGLVGGPTYAIANPKISIDGFE